MQRFVPAVALVAVSALLQTVIFPVAGPLPFWRAQLAFVALVPWFFVLLWVAERSTQPRRSAVLLSYACGVLWYAGHCYWIFQTMHLYGGLSQSMAAVVLVLFCLYLGLYHALFGLVAAAVLTRKPRLRYADALLLAAAWVAVELARAHVTSFPWNLLGYAQIDNAALTRLAPWAGTYALSFLIALANALLAVGLYAWRSGARRTMQVHLGLGGAVIAVCIAAGLVARAPMPAALESAVLVQPNLSVGAESPSASVLPLEAQLSAVTDAAFLTATQQGTAPHLILWPEAPTSYEMHQLPFVSAITALAARHDSTVIVDANAADPNPGLLRQYRLYNAAGLFTAQGMRSRYDKIHLVPFGEFTPYASLFSFAGGLTEQVGNFDRGTRRTPLSDGVHRYGVFICYESIFPAEVRQLVQRGADVLVNLSDDGWYGDTSAPFQHSNMARMRAMENRRWLLRDTNTGITESIDPYGNVREAAPRHQRLATVMHYSYAHDLTFYTRHGDWFAYLCTACTVIALALAWRSNLLTR